MKYAARSQIEYQDYTANNYSSRIAPYALFVRSFLILSFISPLLMVR